MPDYWDDPVYSGGVVGAPVPDDVRGMGRRGRGTARGAYGAPGGISPTTGVPYPSSPPMIGFPPEIYPTADAVDFRQDGQAPGLTSANTPIILVAGSIAGFTGLGLRFQVSPNNLAVVRDVQIIVLGMTPSTNIRWRLKQDGATVPGWDLTINPRTASSVATSELPESTVIRMNEGALIEMEIQVLDAGTYQAGAIFHGWQWPSDL